MIALSALRLYNQTTIMPVLMVSPHPSYLPMEMAAFGIHTITNCYENKKLSTFSDSIISLRTASPASIADTLCRLCEQFSGKGHVTYGEAYVKTGGEFGHIPEEIASILEKRRSTRNE